jgi:hypothetical protein
MTERIIAGPAPIGVDRRQTTNPPLCDRSHTQLA